MPVPYNLIGSLYLAIGMQSPTQEPTFDVQLAVPRPTVRVDVQTSRVAQFESPLRYMLTPAAPSVTAAPGLELLCPAQTRVSTDVPTSVSVQVTPAPTSPTQVELLVTPQVPTPVTPPAQAWTWGPKEMKRFDQASGAFRDRVKNQFGRFGGQEFRFYAQPLQTPAPLPSPRVEFFSPPKGAAPKQWSDLFQPGQQFRFEPKWPKGKSPFMFVPPALPAKPPSRRPNTYLYSLPSAPNGESLWFRPSPSVGVHVPPNSDGLFKTLTPHQRALQKQRGYLRFFDLTPEQRKLLTHPSGRFEIDYHDGQQDLIVKG